MLSDWCFGFLNILLKSVIRIFYIVLGVFSHRTCGLLDRALASCLVGRCSRGSNLGRVVP